MDKPGRASRQKHSRPFSSRDSAGSTKLWRPGASALNSTLDVLADVAEKVCTFLFGGAVRSAMQTGLAGRLGTDSCTCCAYKKRHFSA